MTICKQTHVWTTSGIYLLFFNKTLGYELNFPEKENDLVVSLFSRVGIPVTAYWNSFNGTQHLYSVLVCASPNALHELDIITISILQTEKLAEQKGRTPNQNIMVPFSFWFHSQWKSFRRKQCVSSQPLHMCYLCLETFPYTADHVPSNNRYMD